MLIGRLVGTFGLRGEVKLEPLTDFPERFNSLAQMYVGDDHWRVEVLRCRPHRTHVLIQFAGIDSPEQADKLQGQDVYVPRGEAVDLPEGHYYLYEVVGFNIYLSDGRHLGHITDVIRTGSNDVWVVNEGKNAVLVPVIRDAVVSLDMSDRSAVVETWILNFDE